jgi:hypothetical protein
MNTFFISGHLDLSQTNWDKHYKDKIDNAISNNASFIIGDAAGCDKISSQYLWDNKVTNVIITHLFYKPRHNPGYSTKGEFKGNTQRDTYMTNNSSDDIAWVRSEDETKIIYGNKYRPNCISDTQKNLNRRNK